MAQAVELAPGWLLGRVRLAELEADNGETQAAAAALEGVLAADPGDRYGVALKLAALGLAPTPAAAPPAYVETLFDEYAERFDTSLVGKLGYRMPAILAEELAACRMPLAFDAALDLGCGTGLMGEQLRPLARRLDGVDLSAAMLRKAKAKGLYDDLTAGDLLDEASWSQGAYDLVTAADVLIYFGDLAPVFQSVARRLRPGGLFAFSLEIGESEEAFVVQPSLRYRHGREPLRSNLRTAGFIILRWRECSARRDRDVDVPGLAVVAALDRL